MFLNYLINSLLYINLAIGQMVACRATDSHQFFAILHKQDNYLTEYILRLLFLLGGQNISFDILLNGLEDSIENKKEVALSLIRDLESKNVLRTSIEDGELFINLLIHGDARKSISNKYAWQGSIQGAFRLLSQAFNKDWEHLIVYARENPQIIQIAENFFSILEILQEQPEDVLPIQIHLLEYYMYATREHSKAIELMQKIERSPNFNQLSPELYALFISNKGNIVSTHFSSKPELVKIVIKELETSFKIFHEKKNYGEALRILSCWAQAHIIGGNLEKAISLLRDGESLVTRVDRDRYKAIYYYVYSWCSLESGEYEKSSYYANKASSHLHASIPTPLHFFSRNLNADALYNLRRYKEAYEVACRSLKEATDFNSNRAADWKGEALVVMAKCALRSKQFSLAEKHINEADIEYFNFFKSSVKHIDQAALKTVKGEILLEKGDLEAAKVAFEESQKIYSTLLNKDSWFDEQGILFELLAVLAKKMGDNPSVLYYWKAHKKQFGATHPRTIRIKALLA